MLKKFGMVSVGVTAGLLAVAPLASASECHDGHKDHEKSHSSSHGEHKSHGKGQSCDTTGGKAGAGSEIDGDSLANVVTQAPIGGPAVGSILSCNSDFLNDNLSHNELSIL